MSTKLRGRVLLRRGNQRPSLYSACILGRRLSVRPFRSDCRSSTCHQGAQVDPAKTLSVRLRRYHAFGGGKCTIVQERLPPMEPNPPAPNSGDPNAGTAVLVQGDRVSITDHRVPDNVTKHDLSNRLFVRLIAKGRVFKDVNFSYSIFDTCYLRDCTFDSCNFTGCRFSGSNCYGSKFTGCTFDYSWFERTLLDDSILRGGCPGHDNLKMKFARTLRMNFQQIGDARSANKAIQIELDANRSDLSKAWRSNESYYRKRYTGISRIQVFFKWLGIQVMDVVWGNGESLLKLIRMTVLLLAGMAVVHVILCGDTNLMESYWSAATVSPQVFFGATTPAEYPTGYLTAILLVRLIMFGLFMSIVTKRLNRR